MAKSKKAAPKKIAPKKAAKKKVKYQGEGEAVDPLEVGTSLGELNEEPAITDEQSVADVLNNKAVS